MKVFLVLCLASLAAAGGGEDWQIYKQWMMMKAQDSCWGEENSKLHTVMLKKAVAKCHQVDAPELNLPPFRCVPTLLVYTVTVRIDLFTKSIFLSQRKVSLHGISFLEY